jgi:hypothetical protein
MQSSSPGSIGREVITNTWYDRRTGKYEGKGGRKNQFW